MQQPRLAWQMLAAATFMQVPIVQDLNVTDETCELLCYQSDSVTVFANELSTSLDGKDIKIRSSMKRILQDIRDGSIAHTSRRTSHEHDQHHSLVRRIGVHT